MFQHLRQETLQTVTETLIALGWMSDADIQAMTAGLPPAFVAVAAGRGNGPGRLLVMAAKMNSTRALVSGHVPLRIWLNNCIMLAAAAELPEEEVFRRALEQASPDGVLPPTPLGEVAAHPPADVPDVKTVPHGDKGALEIAIGEDDTLEVSYLHRGSRASRSVAKVLVHRHFDGIPSFLAGNRPDVVPGTGWLIAPRLMITNHHVVNARYPLEGASKPEDFEKQGTATSVLFDFLGDGSKVHETRSLACVASDRTLDFALLRLADDAPDRPSLRLRSNPITRSKDQQLRERVNVLQHPGGSPMRLGFRNNFVVSGSDSRLSYLTDTAGGSSGSPICDDEWFVAALHRGFTTIQGEPVTVWGRAIHQENYGTPIGPILKYLADNHPHLHTEIRAGQSALSPEGGI